jgi:beta-glucanase (GH16 family)
MGVSTSTDYLFDDFPGSSIDLSKWTVYDRLGDQVNSEVNAVIPANVRVSSGSLLIDSKFEDVVAGDTTTGAPNPRTVHYTSGQVAQKAAPFLYGSVRVRAKEPGGTGLWPCIWMLGFEWQASQPFTANVAGSDWPNVGWWEIDIAEFVSNHRSDVNCAVHFNGSNYEEHALPFDSTTRFMVYRLDWAPGSLTWMVDAEDGVGWRTLKTVTGTAGTQIPNTPGYLIIHTAIGGVAGAPDSATFPQTFEVDYAEIQRTADTITPASIGAPVITVTPQALVRTVGGVTQAAGAPTVTVTPQTLVRSTQVSLAAGAPTVTVTPQPLGVSVGAVSVAAGAPTITVTPQPFGVSSSGSTSSPVGAPTVTVTPQPFGVSVGGITRAAGAPVITVTPGPPVFAGSVSLAAGAPAVVVTPQAVARIVGGVLVAAGAPTITVAPQTFMAAPGPYSRQADAPVVVVVAQPMLVTVGGTPVFTGATPPLTAMTTVRSLHATTEVIRP